MILLDHNIPKGQVESLRRARLRPQQIGREVGRQNNGRIYKIEEALEEMPIPNLNCQKGWRGCAWMGEIGGHGY